MSMDANLIACINYYNIDINEILSYTNRTVLWSTHNVGLNISIALGTRKQFTKNWISHRSRFCSITTTSIVLWIKVKLILNFEKDKTIYGSDRNAVSEPVLQYDELFLKIIIILCIDNVSK